MRNLLLDELLGADIRWAGERDRARVMEEVAEEMMRLGRRQYIIPVGGSNPVGTAGYVGDGYARQAVKRSNTEALYLSYRTSARRHTETRNGNMEFCLPSMFPCHPCFRVWARCGILMLIT